MPNRMEMGVTTVVAAKGSEVPCGRLEEGGIKERKRDSAGSLLMLKGYNRGPRATGGPAGSCNKKKSIKQVCSNKDASKKILF